jgi:hypothetical protein
VRPAGEIQTPDLLVRSQTFEINQYPCSSSTDGQRMYYRKSRFIRMTSVFMDTSSSNGMVPRRFTKSCGGVAGQLAGPMA